MIYSPINLRISQFVSNLVDLKIGNNDLAYITKLMFRYNNEKDFAIYMKDAIESKRFQNTKLVSVTFYHFFE